MTAPRVEGKRTTDEGLQALAETTDAEAFELGPAGFALKAMACDLLDARAHVARLTAEVERLREIADDALLQAEVFDEHDPTVRSIRARLAGQSPTPAPEAG